MESKEKFFNRPGSSIYREIKPNWDSAQENENRPCYYYIQPIIYTFQEVLKYFWKYMPLQILSFCLGYKCVAIICQMPFPLFSEWHIRAPPAMEIIIVMAPHQEPSQRTYFFIQEKELYHYDERIFMKLFFCVETLRDKKDQYVGKRSIGQIFSRL